LQPVTRTRRRLLLVVAVIVALGAPAEARAHGTAQVNALDFVARITSVGRSPDAIHAAVIDGGRRFSLRVSGSHTVVVLGYEGEPFLRFSSAGVDVNDRSATAGIVKIASRGSEPALDPRAPPRWSLRSSTNRYAWHDHRLGPKPGRAYGRGNVAGWAIPIVVDGSRERITGRLWHARGPSIWPWLGLLVLSALAATALGRLRNRRLLGAAAVAGAVAACVAALLLSITLGFAPGKSQAAAWANTALSSVIAAAAVGVRAFPRQARLGVAATLAFFAGLSGLSHASVLVHGFVIATLPTAVVRAATATSVCAGFIAAAAGFVSLFDSDPASQRGRGRSARQVSISPRGGPRPR
jgi:hypothetical protein